MFEMFLVNSLQVKMYETAQHNRKDWLGQVMSWSSILFWMGEASLHHPKWDAASSKPSWSWRRLRLHSGTRATRAARLSCCAGCLGRSRGSLGGGLDVHLRVDRRRDGCDNWHQKGSKEPLEDCKQCKQQQTKSVSEDEEKAAKEVLVSNKKNKRINIMATHKLTILFGEHRHGTKNASNRAQFGSLQCSELVSQGQEQKRQQNNSSIFFHTDNKNLRLQ